MLDGASPMKDSVPPSFFVLNPHRGHSSLSTCEFVLRLSLKGEIPKSARMKPPRQ